MNSEDTRGERRWGPGGEGLTDRNTARSNRIKNIPFAVWQVLALRELLAISDRKVSF